MPEGSTDCFETTPIALMELDLSSIARRIATGAPSTGSTYAVEMDDYSPETIVDSVRLVRANTEMLSTVRADSGDEIRRRFSDLFDDESLTSLVAACVAMRRGETDYRTDCICRRLDEKRIHLRLVMRRESDDEELRRVLVAATDVTDDTVFREQLRTLSMIPETNPNVVMAMKCEAEIEYANPTARRWMKSHELTDIRDLYRFLPDSFRERHCAKCDRMNQRQDTYERDGRLYDLKMTPLVGENRCVVYANDVTDTAKLRQERDVLAKAIEASGNAIAITDEAGAIEYVNPTFEELYGYRLEQARGKNPRIINPGKRAYWDMGVSEAEYDALFEGMWQALGSAGSWEGEVLNRTADGDLRWIHLIINRIAGERSNEAKYLAVATDIETLRRRELEARLEILSTITRVAELRDNETGHHMSRVGIFSRLLAEQIGLPLQFCHEIERFAPLHDIGKVGIADDILLARRSLTDEEFSIIKRHTTLGYSILADKPSLAMAAEIARDHHEWYDGSGYPEGRTGDDISLAGRIVAVSDVYDALRSARPYKRPWDHEAARREILAGRGTHFCPRIADAFEVLEAEFAEIAARYQDPS